MRKYILIETSGKDHKEVHDAVSLLSEEYRMNFLVLPDNVNVEVSIDNLEVDRPWLEKNGWESCNQTDGHRAYFIDTGSGTCYYYENNKTAVIGGFAGVGIKIKSRGQLLSLVRGMS